MSERKRLHTDEERHAQIQKEIDTSWGRIIYGIGLPDDPLLHEHIAYMIYHKALTLLTDIEKVGLVNTTQYNIHNEKKKKEVRDFISDLFQMTIHLIESKGYR